MGGVSQPTDFTAAVVFFRDEAHCDPQTHQPGIRSNHLDTFNNAMHDIRHHDAPPPPLRTRGTIASRSVNMVRHPRGSCLWSDHIRKQSKLIGDVIHKQESRHKMPKFVLRAVLGRMQLTLHATRRTPHGAPRLVRAMSAWLVETRRAPSRHSRDARIYGHTTTAMHKRSTPPPLQMPRLRAA